MVGERMVGEQSCRVSLGGVNTSFNKDHNLKQIDIFLSVLLIPGIIDYTGTYKIIVSL